MTVKCASRSLRPVIQGARPALGRQEPIAPHHARVRYQEAIRKIQIADMNIG